MYKLTHDPPLNMLSNNNSEGTMNMRCWLKLQIQVCKAPEKSIKFKRKTKVSLKARMGKSSTCTPPYFYQ